MTPLPVQEATITAQITGAILEADFEEIFEEAEVVEREVEVGAMKVAIEAVNQNVEITATEEMIGHRLESLSEVRREVVA